MGAVSSAISPNQFAEIRSTSALESHNLPYKNKQEQEQELVNYDELVKTCITETLRRPLANSNGILPNGQTIKNLSAAWWGSKVGKLSAPQVGIELLAETLRSIEGQRNRERLNWGMAVNEYKDRLVNRDTALLQASDLEIIKEDTPDNVPAILRAAEVDSQRPPIPVSWKWAQWRLVPFGPPQDERAAAAWLENDPYAEYRSFLGGYGIGIDVTGKRAGYQHSLDDPKASLREKELAQECLRSLDEHGGIPKEFLTKYLRKPPGREYGSAHSRAAG